MAETLAGSEIASLYLVATEYGKEVMPNVDFIEVRVGRMNSEDMAAFYVRERPIAVIDATHPYAKEVKKEIDKSLEKFPDLPFFRLSRKEVEIPEGACTYFETAEDCVKALEKTRGKIFLTTGSKELSVFCKNEEIRDRIVARVIPGLDSLKICEFNDLKGEQIIAMQGPFSEEMNLVTMKDYDIKYLVMKESGKEGGQETRIDAAMQAGVTCFVIKRPESIESTLTFVQVLNKVSELTGKIIVEDYDEFPYKNPDKDVIISVTLAGYGMSKETNTKELYEKIASADYVFGSARILVEIDTKAKKLPYYKAEDIMTALENLEWDENSLVDVLILFSGDSGFYSGCKKMCQCLEGNDRFAVKVLPGISSISTLAARVKESWDDAYLMTSHGLSEKDWIGEFTDGARFNSKLFAVTSGAKDLRIMAEVLSSLQDKGVGKYTITAGFNLCFDEKIYIFSPQKAKTFDADGLCTVFVKNETPQTKRLAPGFNDDSFIRESIPMSKEEVRSLSICKLDLWDGGVIYDVGAGSGSVAVEMAYLAPHSQVYAVELNSDACRLISKNASKHCVNNLHVISGIAPDVFSDLPKPTHVFIGGTGGRLDEIIGRLKANLMPVNVVINAVTIETIAEINQVIKKYKIGDYDITQVVIAKSKQAGDYNLMQGQNPVYIMSFKL